MVAPRIHRIFWHLQLDVVLVGLTLNHKTSQRLVDEESHKLLETRSFVDFSGSMFVISCYVHADPVVKFETGPILSRL